MSDGTENNETLVNLTATVVSRE
ncbi:hypothetical protein WCLP8_1810006 [uncultured Gammaproteobacteria bacterium]